MEAQPLEVWLWDEVSGEWGPAYPREVTDLSPPQEVHEAVNEFIDHEPEEDEIRYHLNMAFLWVNIGELDRGHWYVELWGPDAVAVKDKLKEGPGQDEPWYPDSMEQALFDIVRIHSQLPKNR